MSNLCKNAGHKRNALACICPYRDLPKRRVIKKIYIEDIYKC